MIVQIPLTWSQYFWSQTYINGIFIKKIIVQPQRKEKTDPYFQAASMLGECVGSELSTMQTVCIRFPSRFIFLVLNTGGFFNDTDS